VSPRILVVQHDQQLRQRIAGSLEQNGHEVLFAASVLETQRACEGRQPDALIVDLALPGQPILSFVRRLRDDHRTRSTAIVVMSADACEDRKVLGFEAGADDFVTIPFSDRELAARIDAILRRRRGDFRGDIVMGSLRIDSLSQRVMAAEHELNLTPIEYRLLHFLMTHAGQILTRPQLAAAVRLDGAQIRERSVDVHFNRLRRRLASTGHDRLIETVTGLGYRFRSC
jgi:two-component system phosphate regulon response regulator PhoB